MANIEVITQINDLLDANDVTIAKTALGVLGAVTTGNASIVNADISATAAINVSKLTSSSATAGFVLTSSGTAAAPTFQSVAGTGDVVGPAGATDNAIARFDTGTGKLLQNSPVTVSDAGAITTPQLTASVIPFYYSELQYFPLASAVNHGAIAHAHDTGAMYYSHNSAWVKMLDTGTPVTVAQGGTNATTAATARTNILPSFTGNGGKVLAVNAAATDVEYIAAGGAGGNLTSGPVLSTSGSTTIASRIMHNKNSTSGYSELNTVVGIGDSYLRRYKAYVSEHPANDGTMRGVEGAYNRINGATEDSTYIYSTGAIQNLPIGGSSDYAFNGSAGPMRSISVIYLKQPSGGNLLVQRKVGSGSFTTITTISTANATLDAGIYEVDLLTNPSAGFTAADYLLNNEIRCLASAGNVKIIAVGCYKNTSGLRNFTFESVSGTDWGNQLAGLNSAVFAKVIALTGADTLIYSYADTVMSPQWKDDVYPAIRTAAPNCQIVVWNPNPIKTTNVNYSTIVQSIDDSRTWCSANGVPLFDIAAMIPSYEIGLLWGIFDANDEIHTNNAGSGAIGAAYHRHVSSAWPKQLQRRLVPPIGNIYGWRIKDTLEISGSATSSLRFYNRDLINPLVYSEIFNNDTGFNIVAGSGGMALRISGYGVVPPSTNDTFTVGKSGQRWGYFYGNHGNFATSLTVGSGAAALGIFSSTAALDFPSIGALGEATLTITVTGAVTTNNPSVSLGWSAALETGIVVKQAWVSATNTVSIRLANITAASIDPASITCRATVTNF